MGVQMIDYRDYDMNDIMTEYQKQARVKMKTILAICRTNRWKGRDYSSWTRHMPEWVYSEKLLLIEDLFGERKLKLLVWNPIRYEKEYKNERQ